MVDLWHAECVPCGWLELCDTQDEAIEAAEEHVYAHHARVPSKERAERKMGHVQNRTVGVIPRAILPVAGEPVEYDLGSGAAQEVLKPASDTQETSE